MFKSVIAGYTRSPFTIAKKGELIDVKPDKLLTEVIKNLISKSKINKADIEDVIIGCAFPEGEQGFNIGKIVTFLSNMNIKTAGTTINRWCGSSMSALLSFDFEIRFLITSESNSSGLTSISSPFLAIVNGDLE